MDCSADEGDRLALTNLHQGRASPIEFQLCGAGRHLAWPVGSIGFEWVEVTESWECERLRVLKDEVPTCASKEGGEQTCGVHDECLVVWS